MSQEDSFAEWMRRLRAGDEEAAAQIVQRFTQRLVAVVRRRTKDWLRPKMDPEDVTQSVYRSFFCRHAQGEFADLRDWSSLWHLLAHITLRKCGHRIRYYQAARRNVRRETAPRFSTEDESKGWEQIAREPTPEEAAMLVETLEKLISELPSHERHILELSLQGQTVVEISAQVGYTERTVQRVLERVRKELERQCSGDDE